MNVNDLIDILKSGGVVINNLNITLNNAETIINGDGATVNRITAPTQQQRHQPLIASGSDGVDYRYSHCAPLDESVGDWYRAERRRADAEYFNRK